MNEVRPVLANNNGISAVQKHLKATNIGIVKYTCMKINTELNNDLVNNT